jgi:hypothetical protein
MFATDSFSGSCSQLSAVHCRHLRKAVGTQPLILPATPAARLPAIPAASNYRHRHHRFQKKANLNQQYKPATMQFNFKNNNRVQSVEI